MDSELSATHLVTLKTKWKKILLSAAILLATSVRQAEIIKTRLKFS